MPYRFRERLGMWLQRFQFLDPVLLEYDGITPSGARRYVNRVSRHLVSRPPVSADV